MIRVHVHVASQFGRTGIERRTRRESNPNQDLREAPARPRRGAHVDDGGASGARVRPDPAALDLGIWPNRCHAENQRG